MLLSMITLIKNPLKLVCSEKLFISDTWFGWQTPLRSPSLASERLVKGCRPFDSSGESGL